MPSQMYIRTPPPTGMKAPPRKSVAIIEEGTLDGFGTWTLSEDGLLTIDGIGVMPDWAQTLKEDSVVPWVSYRGQITEVHLSDGITSIGRYAFKSCSELTRINIPNGITHIGHHAFAYCVNLCQADLPDSIVYIGSGAFWGCRSLSRIDFPDSVTYIGNQAFGRCINLTRVDIPRNMVYLGDRAFSNCLQAVTMPSRFNKPFFENYFGFPSDIITFYEAEIFPVIVAADTFKGFGQWSLDEKGLLKIEGKGAMPYWFLDKDVPWHSYREQIQEVYLSDGITSIGRYAFRNCNELLKITVPDSITTIECGAFNNCTKLTEITLPKNLTSIGSEAFEECVSLTEVIIPDSVTHIGFGAFSGCSSVKELSVPDKTVEIAHFALPNNDWITSGTIEGFGAWFVCYKSKVGMHLSIIGKGKMPDLDHGGPWNYWNGKRLGGIHSEINSIYVSQFVTSIGDWAFHDSERLYWVTLPASITHIGAGAFSGCSYLKEISIPPSVTEIGSYAFQDCWSLTQITIPNSVTRIWGDAFKNCYSLKKVHMPRRFNRPLFKFYYGISKDIVTFY